MTYRKLLNQIAGQLDWMRNQDAGYVASDLREMSNALYKQVKAKLDKALFEAGEMPDEIWAGTETGDCWFHDKEFGNDVEYIRKDATHECLDANDYLPKKYFAKDRDNFLFWLEDGKIRFEKFGVLYGHLKEEKLDSFYKQFRALPVLDWGWASETTGEKS